MKQFNAFKALKHPAHGRFGSGLIDLVRNGLLALLQTLAQATFGQTIDQQTEHHDETESDQTAWLLHKHRGCQEQRVFQETKASLDTALLFIDCPQRFIGEFVGREFIGSNQEASPPISSTL